MPEEQNLSPSEKESAGPNLVEPAAPETFSTGHNLSEATLPQHELSQSVETDDSEKNSPKKSCPTEQFDAEFSQLETAALCRFFQTQLPSNIEPLDVVQDMSVELLKSPKTYDGGRSSILFGIGRNHVLRQFRFLGTQANRKLAEEVYARQRNDTASDPAVIVSQAEERARSIEALWSALSNLDDIFVQVIVLRYLNDPPLAIKEIAGILEIPPGTVQSRLTRSRAYLRTYLREIDVDET